MVSQIKQLRLIHIFQGQMVAESHLSCCKKFKMTFKISSKKITWWMLVWLHQSMRNFFQTWSLLFENCFVQIMSKIFFVVISKQKHLHDHQIIQHTSILEPKQFQMFFCNKINQIAYQTFFVQTIWSCLDEMCLPDNCDLPAWLHMHRALVESHLWKTYVPILSLKALWVEWSWRTNDSEWLNFKAWSLLIAVFW